MERKITRFEDLEVWKKSHGLVIEVYAITKKFPSEEKFGLAAQMRRTAVSIAANIAEGFKRRSPRDKLHFLGVSQGSLEELKYYFMLSRDLGYASIDGNSQNLLESIGKMLYGLMKSIQQGPMDSRQ